ncbi:MAG: hypothetical protein RIQ50_1661 [Bacteroidota bacterium]
MWHLGWKSNSTFIYFFVVTIMLTSSSLYAQRFGANPAALKWKQVDSPGFRLIFPEGQQRNVHAITQRLAQSDAILNGRLGNEVKKIPIVLQTLPLVSNAYVGLGPWRSEFYMFPPQNSLELGSNAWSENLAVHEYRHAHQFSNFRKGISRVGYWVAGEQGQALLNSASVPDWFFEGDAVYHETRLLSQGRGRLPMFFDAYHALWKDNRVYSFQKLRNGSLKHFVPNHYHLGYILVAHGNNAYGDEFWKKVTSDAVRYKGLFYPFQRAIKVHSGRTYKEFVANAMNEFKQTTVSSPDASTKVNKTTRVTTDYQYPVFLDQDSILVLKKAYNQIPHWVIIHKGQSKRVATKEIGYEDYFTYKKGFVVYTRTTFDARWAWREYSEIVLKNIFDHSREVLLKKGRYFSPDLSNSAEQVVAVNVSPDGLSELHIIDRATKNTVHRFTGMSEDYLSYPVFSKNDEQIFFIARKPDGRSGIYAWHPTGQEVQTVLAPVNAPISILRERENVLLFTISQSGRNELWTLDTRNGKTNRVAASETGSYAGDMHAPTNRYVFSRPTSTGESVFTLKGELQNITEQPSAIKMVHPIQREEQLVMEYTAAEPSYGKHYSRLNNPINIHSWRPFYEQPEWSFSMYGENVLNTVQTTLEYVYNENEGSHKVGASMLYGGTHPWITAATGYTMNRSFQDSSRSLRWNEWNSAIGLYLPFNFSSGIFYKRLEVLTRFNTSSVQYNESSIPKPGNRFLPSIQNQVVWSIQTQQAIQHIFPRFAWTVRLQHRFATGPTRAGQLFGGSTLYLPGVLKTHSFVTSISFQGRDTLRQYLFTNIYPTARGYQSFDFPRMWRYSFNYHLPLAYPDWGFANIVYFQRVRSNLFFDQSNLKSLRTGNVTQLRSAGVEVYFDTRWWNQQKVSFGVRYSRLLDNDLFINKINTNNWQFIMPVDLFPNR